MTGVWHMADFMEYRVENNGLGVSLLGFGAMRLPCFKAEKEGEQGAIDLAATAEMAEYAFSHGVTYFDTAYMYHGGESERALGEVLKKYPREAFFITDKLPIWMCEKKEDVAAVFENQKKKTGFNRFDYYLLHSLDGENFDKCEEFGAYNFLCERQKAGEIGKIGFSFHGSIDDLKRIVGSHSWDFAQIQLNYLDWEDSDAKTQYEILTAAGIPVIIMEPVRGGKLASPGARAEKLLSDAAPGKSAASWAIRYAASLPNVITVLSGMSNLEQMKDNIDTMTGFRALGKADYELLDRVAAILREPDLIPCTGCDYCADCPQSVKISSIFKIYNSLESKEIDRDAAREKYSALENTAEACVKCGLCAGHCPQSLDIPRLLEEKSEKLK